MAATYRLDPDLSRRAAARLHGGFARAGWTPTHGNDWDLFWGHGAPNPDAFISLGGGKRFNHFPGFAAFGHKGQLHRNLSAARDRVRDPAFYRFHPRSYSVPEDYDRWRAVADAEPDRLWIIKPPRGGQGQGISLVADPDRAPKDGEWVIQEYLDRPHLIDGRKYVLRVWVLIASLDPFVCYLHTNGVFKMTSTPFTSDPTSIDDLTIHLTNPSVQAAHPDVPLGSLNSDLHAYRRRLTEEGIDELALFDRIRDVVAQAVIACRDAALKQSRRVSTRLEGCFELLGPDILIDEDLEPWVLELNTFPSLEVSKEAGAEAAAVVRAAKDEMVADVASFCSFEAGEFSPSVGGFELLWPGPDADRFSRCFPLLRPRDRALAGRMCPGISSIEPFPRLKPSIEAHPVGEGLALREPQSGRMYSLDSVGAAVWLCLADDLSPAAVIDELAAVFPEEPQRRIADDVWDLLSMWAEHGLLSGFESPKSESEPESFPEKEERHGIGEERQARSA
jgi:tubulin polyglutamylase TTLL5